MCRRCSGTPITPVTSIYISINNTINIMLHVDELLQYLVSLSDESGHPILGH